MENLKEKFEVVWNKQKFEVVWNTKHKDDIKMVFKIPVGRRKRWWEFWKVDESKKAVIEIMDRMKEDVSFDEESGEIFIPLNKSK